MALASWRSVASVRWNDFNSTGSRNLWRTTTRGAANSRRPSAPWTRPNPESPIPPNGAEGSSAVPNTELTDTMPTRNRAAIC